MRISKLEYKRKIKTFNVGEIAREFNELIHERKKIGQKIDPLIKSMEKYFDGNISIELGKVEQMEKELDRLMDELKEIDWKVGVVGKAIKKFIK